MAVFSDLLTEYLDLREEGEPDEDEWMSIERRYQLRNNRRDRMEYLLSEMDRLAPDPDA